MSEANPTVWEVKLDDIPQEYWANSILMRLAGALGLVSPLDYETNPEPFEIDADWLLEEVETRLREWEPQGVEETLLQETVIYVNDEKFIMYRNRETGNMVVPDKVQDALGEEGMQTVRDYLEDRPHLAFRVYTPEWEDEHGRGLE